MKKLNEWKDQKNQDDKGSTTTFDIEDNEGFVKYAKLTFFAVFAFAVGYIVLDQIKRPNTYEELLPLMEEAIEFDSRVTDYAKSYEPIENQIDEDVYFEAIESEYQPSVNIQAKMIEDIERMDEQVRQAGGITNFEELQSIKSTPTDPYAAKQLEKAMDMYGKNE